MSSSFLANKMKKAAKAKGIPLLIEAQSEINVPIFLPKTDILLVAPHCVNSLNKLEQLAQAYQVPILVISHEIYGLQKGEELLELALKTIQTK